MATNKTPGTYVEEISKFPPSVVQVETAIPAFIGYTEKAEKDGVVISGKPIIIHSLLDFETYFGGTYIYQAGDIQVRLNEVTGFSVNDILFTGKLFFLYHSIRLFFDNGGSKCYIVSAASYTNTAFTNGTLNNAAALTAALNTVEKENDVTIIVMPDAVSLAANDCYTLQNAAVAQCGRLQDRIALLDLKENMLHQFNATVDEFRNNINGDNLKFAAAYAPWLYFSYPVNVDPDIFQDNVFNHDGSSAIDYATLIEPIKTNISDAVKKAFSRIPPCAAVAGVYALVDSTRGVWKAPANISLNSISSPSETIINTQQETLNVDLNGKSINVIRSFVGKGTLIWGARTLSGNDNDWRYINVRRFFNMVEVSCKMATQAFVFEPNDANTWMRIKAMLENFLVNLWRQGALQGAKPEDAFYVNIGLGRTMTAQDILEGRLIIDIGMAVVRPAEFIIVTFSLKMAQS
ncbi:MAG: phage tail sheath C-terminal domain-containing protein [Ferruginibacter sp.]